MAVAMMLVKRLRRAKGIETRPLVGARRIWLSKRLLTTTGMMMAAEIRYIIFGLRWNSLPDGRGLKYGRLPAQDGRADGPRWSLGLAKLVCLLLILIWVIVNILLLFKSCCVDVGKIMQRVIWFSLTTSNDV